MKALAAEALLGGGHEDDAVLQERPRGQTIDEYLTSSPELPKPKTPNTWASHYFWCDSASMDVAWDYKTMHHDSIFRTKWDSVTSFLLLYLGLLLPTVLAFNINGSFIGLMSNFQTVSV
jgi:hypothetical protein